MDELTSKMDLSEWTQDDKKKLLDIILDMAGGSTKKSYKAAETSLKWENIKLEGKSAEECKAMYQKLTSKVRKYRTMQEIISDAVVLATAEPTAASMIELADFPKKPITAFSLFLRKRSKKFPDVKGTNRMKVFANDWNELSEEKKEAYKKKYAKLKKKYEENLDIFRQNHPEYLVPGANSAGRPQPPLPSKLFVESRLEKLKSKHAELSHSEAVKKLVDRYKKMSDRKKLKWINKAKDSLPNYQHQCELYLAQNPKSVLKPAVLHLSKEEQRIWNFSKGKPVTAPPKNMFMYFCNTRREGMHHLSRTEQSKELSVIYHQLSDDELKDLADKFRQDIEEYVKSYDEYYQSLSEEEKNLEKSPGEALAVYHKILKNNGKKKKKKKKKTKDDVVKSDQTNGNMVKLSDLLPRPDSADEDASQSDSDDSPPSSEVVIRSKRKSHHEEPASPQKKKKKKIDQDIESSPSLKTSAHFSEDALLSLWSPLKSVKTQLQDDNNLDHHMTKSKTPKSTKLSKSYVEI